MKIYNSSYYFCCPLHSGPIKYVITFLLRHSTLAEQTSPLSDQSESPNSAAFMAVSQLWEVVSSVQAVLTQHEQQYLTEEQRGQELAWSTSAAHGQAAACLQQLDPDTRLITQTGEGVHHLGKHMLAKQPFLISAGKAVILSLPFSHTDYCESHLLLGF